MAHSYRSAIQALIHREEVLDGEYRRMAPGVERDRVDARRKVIRQELGELGQVLAELEDYLIARGLMPQPPKAAPAPAPVKRKRGRPRKIRPAQEGEAHA